MQPQNQNPPNLQPAYVPPVTTGIVVGEAKSPQSLVLPDAGNKKNIATNKLPIGQAASSMGYGGPHPTTKMHRFIVTVLCLIMLAAAIHGVWYVKNVLSDPNATGLNSNQYKLQ